METIGEILKNAREKKGLTIETLEKNTHIVSRYIEALENNEFDKLPGEIYIKGFIKNLSDKLSLDSNAVLERYSLQVNETKFERDLYGNETNVKNTTKKREKEAKAKNKEKRMGDSSEEAKREIKKAAISNVNEEFNKAKPKIRNNISNPESDLLTATRRDLERLKNKNREFPIVPIIVVIAILVILIVVFVSLVLPNLRRTRSRNNIEGETEIARNIVNSSKSTQNVKAGDIIHFKPMGKEANIEFNRIGNVIDLNINGQDFSLSKSNPIIMDLSGNGINDFKINVVEIYNNLATVEMEILEENQMINAGFISNNIVGNFQDYNSAISTISNFQIIDGETYIQQNIEKSSINIEITSRGFVYLRYFIDSGTPSTQNLSSGRVINLTAEDVIMLTIGNAGEVAVRVNGATVNMGEAGETVNKTIKWVRNLNDSTKYNLIMSDTR